MATEETTTTTTVAADDAERARAAADQAAAAASSAAALAQAEAANVSDQARQGIAAFEERLASCQSQLEGLRGSLSADQEARRQELSTLESKIMEALRPTPPPPPPPPEPLTNPPQGQAGAAGNGTPAPEEPPANQARRKAHRWI
jgi:hypothetical protein